MQNSLGRKLAIMFLAATLASAPLTAMAAADSDSAGPSDYVQAITNRINAQKGNEDTKDNADRIERIMSKLSSESSMVQDGGSKYNNVDSTKGLIDAIVANAWDEASSSGSSDSSGGDSAVVVGDEDDKSSIKIYASHQDMNQKYFANIWKTKFESDAALYNIPALPSETGSDANSSTGLNVLTWNNTTGRGTNGKTVTLSAGQQGKISTLLTAVDQIPDFSTWIRGIAIAMTVVYGTMSLMTLAMDKNMSIEALEREFVKIMIGVWVIVNFRFFALLTIRAGTLITDMLLSMDVTSNQKAKVWQCLWQSLAETIIDHPDLESLTAEASSGIAASSTNTSFVSGIVKAVSSVFGGWFNGVNNAIGGNLIDAALVFFTYSVLIELALRYMFAPLSIADLYTDRMRSTGVTNLKRLFACAMQGGIMFMIVYITAILKSYADANILVDLAINLTMIGMFARSRAIAYEIVGVH